MYTTIEIEEKKPIATIWLNRPAIRNAINETMISELIEAFMLLNQSNDVRIILLRGKGNVFCAGADLNWMKDAVSYTYEQNNKESQQLAKCFHTIYSSAKPTIAIIQGAAMGGANGLLCACDFAYAITDTIFAFSEVKIGLIPATIAPYILKKIGEARARDLMLTGRKINGTEAEKLGLINAALSETALTAQLTSTIKELLTAGPESIKQCKILLSHLANTSTEELITYTAEIIAQCRSSAEGQEGMQAFLEKKKPLWAKDSDAFLLQS